MNAGNNLNEIEGALLMFDKIRKANSQRIGRYDVSVMQSGGNGTSQSQLITRGCVVAALLLGMMGCGSDDSGGSDSGVSPTPPSSTQISAVDGFSVVRPGVATRVDLSPYVRGADATATLTSISSEQANCITSNVSGLAVDITSENGLCEFSYKISGQGQEASATLNTLASTLESPMLPPLSQTMDLSDTSKTFDLMSLLGSDWPAGYSLDPDSLLVQGGSAQGTATANGFLITYMPPSTSEPVWNQIFYVLKDPNKPGEDALGVLYVTVSDSVNRPPVIGAPDQKYDYNASTGNGVLIMETVTLDLSTLPGLNITEPDGDEWQLYEVKSYSATVRPVNASSVTNKQFTFQAAIPGDHIVTFIVGDHRAGFSIGLIKINVGVAESVKTWNNITIGEKTFQATPVYSEVINRGVLAEAVYDDVVVNYVAGVNDVAAQSYCSNSNHLASKEELDLLRTTAAVNTERLKYPVERTYITYGTDGQPLTYVLNTGTTTAYNPSSSPTQYVICVSESSMTYTPVMTSYGIDTALSDGSWWPLGTLVSEGGAGAPTLLTSTSIGQTALTAANVRLNPAGCVQGTCNVEVKGDERTYGAMTVAIANAANPLNTINIGPLTLLQNAKVADVSVGNDGAKPTGIDTNTLVVSVVDAGGAPLPNTAVKLQYSAPSGVTVLPASCANATACTPVTTDSNGHITLSLTTNVGGSYAVNFAANALVGGVTGNAMVATSTFKATDMAEPTCDRTAGAGNGGFITPTSTLRTWSAANNYCISMNARLPTAEELVLLAYNYGAYDGTGGSIGSACGWPDNNGYWSSTVFSASAGFHYYVNLAYGGVGYYSDNNPFYVACVR